MIHRICGILFLLLLLMSESIFAQEVYLLINFPERAAVYRALSSNPSQLPIGYVFDAEPSKFFFIDGQGNYRLISSRVSSDFQPLPEMISRELSAEMAGKSLDLPKHQGQWELKQYEYVEAIWRGYQPGKVLERNVGVVEDLRLAGSALPAVFNARGGCSSFYSAGKLTEGELLFYSWSGGRSGQLYSNGEFSSDFRPVVESADPDNRFIGYVGRDNTAKLVIGADILESWLEQGDRLASVDCSMAAFCSPEFADITLIFALSLNQSRLYRFSASLDAAKIKIVDVDFIELPFKPRAICADKLGNLYLAAIESLPVTLVADSDLVTGFEIMEFTDAEADSGQASEEEALAMRKIRRDRRGRLVFAHTHYAGIYRLAYDRTDLELCERVFLDKTYMSCDFELKNISENDISDGISKILQLLKEPGNSMSVLKSPVSGFPDQFKAPDGMLLAVSE